MQQHLCYTHAMTDRRSPSSIAAAVLAVLLAMHGAAAAAEMLSLRDCIDRALRNQPAIRSAREGVHASQGRETQAASPYYPQVTGSTGYSETHAQGGAFGDSISKVYTSTLALNLTIYDFGRTGHSFDAAKANVRSS